MKTEKITISLGSINKKEGPCPEYNIETINDLYQVITDDNLEMIMTDMKALLQHTLNIDHNRKLLDPNAKKLRLSNFKWIDDWSDKDKEDHKNYKKD